MFLCILLYGSVIYADSAKPNIVFILADDLGYGDLSIYGQQKFTTPNIDRIGTEGMKFTQMYAGSTVCAPSRCSLMTGLDTGHCFVRGNMGGKPFGETPLPAKTVTLTSKLKNAGYAVGVFGKWGLGAVGNEGYPGNHGVDTFYGYYSQMEAHNYYPPRLHSNDKEIPLDGKTYSHDLIVQNAFQFIRDNKDKPFFCYMPVTIPHAAMQVPEDYMTPWREKFPEFENVIGLYSHGTKVKNPIAAFPAMLTKLDDNVGQLFALLKELNLDENTIIIFSSDNGPHAEGGHRPKFFDSNGQFQGIKRDLFDGGIREPFLIRWPAHIKPGCVSDHIAAFWDILPTFCDIINVESPEHIDGISFLPTLLNNPTDQKNHEYLYWEFHEKGGKRAVRFGNWKAIQLDVYKNPNGPILLFDIEKDPGEENNLADQHPELIQKVRQIFQNARTENQFWNFPDKITLDKKIPNKKKANKK